MVAVTEPHSGRAKEAKQGISCTISQLQIDERDAQDIRQDCQGVWSCRATALFGREETIGHRYATQEQPRAGV